MPPVFFICLLILCFSLTILIVLVVKHQNDRKKNSYTPSTCSICGNQTGIPGNRRFRLIDGCLCEECVFKMTRNRAGANLYGPELFLNKTAIKTVADAVHLMGIIDEMGEERWQQMLDEAGTKLSEKK